MTARFVKARRHGVTTMAVVAAVGLPRFYGRCEACGRESALSATTAGVAVWAAAHLGRDLSAEVDVVCADLRAAFEVNREFAAITKEVA